MTYPWPGMNPWLENTSLWRDFHHRLITALADELGPRLRPRYFVAVETHTLVTARPDAPTLARYPDLMVVHRGGPAVATAEAEEVDQYVSVELELVTIEVGYLEVRLVPHGEVVTVIEVLSYSNKLPGRDREAYIAKREELLRTDVGFVEIDLLRAGQPMPYTEAAASDYRLFIRRREQPFHARLYPFGVRQRIPTFPLPLLPNDTEPKVDLGSLIQGVYERAGYDLVIDYNQPPVPPLGDEDTGWAKELLANEASTSDLS